MDHILKQVGHAHYVQPFSFSEVAVGRHGLAFGSESLVGSACVQINTFISRVSYKFETMSMTFFRWQHTSR